MMRPNDVEASESPSSGNSHELSWMDQFASVMLSRVPRLATSGVEFCLGMAAWLGE